MTAWLLSLMLALVPPGKVPARESAEAGFARYQDIAADIASVTHDRRTAALLVAIAVHESGLRLDVDTGATRGPAPYRACGLWQLVGVDCSLSRRELAALARERALGSLGACIASPERFRLAAYASGSCSRGLPESAAMIDSWKRMLHEN